MDARTHQRPVRQTRTTRRLSRTRRLQTQRNRQGTVTTYTYSNILPEPTLVNGQPFYVINYNNKTIGCGGFGDKDNNGIISLAWGLIHKDFHKMGYGEKLLNYRIEQIKLLKPKFPVIIDTTQYSYGFFEKYGFKVTKITNDYYEIGMHRYDMILEI